MRTGDGRPQRQRIHAPVVHVGNQQQEAAREERPQHDEGAWQRCHP